MRCDTLPRLCMIPRFKNGISKKEMNMKKFITTLCIAAMMLGATSPASARNSSRRIRIGNKAKPMKGNTSTQPPATVAPLPAAAPETSAATGAFAPGIATLNASGSITALDAQARSLEVAGKKFNVRDSVEITVNGTAGSWGDAKIKTGAKATVNYTASSTGDVLFVNRIAITTK